MKRICFALMALLALASCKKERRVEYELTMAQKSEAHVTYYGNGGVSDIYTANNGFGHSYYDEPGQQMFFKVELFNKHDTDFVFQVRIDGDLYYEFRDTTDLPVLFTYKELIPEK